MAIENGIEVQVTTVVRVEIVAPNNLGQFSGEYYNLLNEFNWWQREKQIFATFIASGLGPCVVFFDLKDLSAVKAFFKEKGFEVE